MTLGGVYSILSGTKLRNFSYQAESHGMMVCGSWKARMQKRKDFGPFRLAQMNQLHPSLWVRWKLYRGISYRASESIRSASPTPSLRTDKEKARVLEAVLLIAREPLSTRKLAVLAELDDPTEARTLARRLNDDYDAQGYSFRIEEVAGGLQILTRPQFANWLRRLELAPGEVLLSQGMLETLAVIAYRQPVQRAEIEAIRGVGCDEVLRQLMQRDLVRIAGRHEELGRPYLYGTTRKFMQLFGLQSLDSLPRAQKIRLAEAEIASRLAGESSPAQDMAGETDPESF